MAELRSCGGKKTKGFIRISLLRKSKKKAFDIMRVFALDGVKKGRFKLSRNMDETNQI